LDDKVNYPLVGAFVIALSAALVVAVLWLAAGVNTKKKVAPYQAVIAESVAGLSVAAPVKYLGVDVGKISGIAIDPDDSRQVRVQMQIERGTPIKRDTEAVLKTQGLTGIAYIELSGGTAGSPSLISDGEGVVPTIGSKPSLSARLEDVLTSTLEKLDRTTASLDAILDADNRAALRSTLADTAAVARMLAAQKTAIASGIDDAARTARFAADAGRKLGPAIDRIAAGADAVDRMAQDARRASRQAGTAADAAAGSLQDISTGTLPELDRLLAELNALASTLRALGEQTERHPNSLLLGAPRRALGPGERATP